MSNPIPSVFETEMFKLAMASNAGARCEQPIIDPKTISTRVEKAISDFFSTYQLTDWKIVWGPGVWVNPAATIKRYPSNVMFAAYNQSTNTYVVSVAGTNPNSTFDLLSEDWDSTGTAWQWAKGGGNITKGWAVGLSILQQMQPTFVAGSGTLDAFLGQQLQDAKGPVTIITTGHSLGGALAPLLACWLGDTASTWNKKPNATHSLNCWRFAGPTPGDSTFQKHYNATVTGTTTNVNNTLDMVPLAYDSIKMITIPTLYGREAPCSNQLTACVANKVAKVSPYGYCQVGSTTTFDGTVFTGMPAPTGKNAQEIACAKFLAQAMYQHIPAYFGYYSLIAPPPFTAAKNYQGCTDAEELCKDQNLLKC